MLSDDVLNKGIYMKKLLCFGEILWDVFPEKRELGGASLNFSAHFVKLGGEAKIISAVGTEELGAETLEKVAELGVNTSLISVIDKKTGVCDVTVDAMGKPSYDLIKDVAYDNIPHSKEAEAVLKNECVDVIYFGTLAQRAQVSKATLKKIIEKAKCTEIFCDINIRQDYYSGELLKECFNNATIVKISRDEFHVLAETGIAKAMTESSFVEYAESVCRALCKEYAIKLVVVTLDKDGAMVYEAQSDKTYISRVPQSKPVSTVGAGDSFSASFVINYLRGEPIKVCLERGVTLSDYVITKLGAVPEYPEELKKEHGM